MPNKPKKWVAALLGFVAQPIAMMYVARITWAGVYFLASVAIAVIGDFYLHDMELAALASQIALALTCATHAYRVAAKYPDEQLRPSYSRWYSLLGTVAAFVSIVFGVRAFLVEPFRFPSGSMLPTIPVGSHLIIQKWGYGNYGSYGLNLTHASISAPLNRGDIVIFEFPQDRSKTYAKRLVGLPGDKIVYREKKLFINGSAVSTHVAGKHVDPKSQVSTPRFIESMMGTDYSVLIEREAPAYVATPLAFPFREKCTYFADGLSCDVPAGQYFTMGDNRDNSFDSRMWGFVPADHIVGKVLYILR
ncbi:MAG: signal peptidase I [Rhodocyclaceae bacterium]|nr:MAG: signal peptidase I [Rhodocyclaceae bacterium]